MDLILISLIWQVRELNRAYRHVLIILVSLEKLPCLGSSPHEAVYFWLLPEACRSKTTGRWRQLFEFWIVTNDLRHKNNRNQHM